MDQQQPSAPASPPAPPAQPTAKKSNSTKTILIVLGSCAVLFIIVILVLVLMVRSGLNGARSNVKDAKIKSDVMQTVSSLEVYYNDHSTYVGFSVDPATQSDAKTNGSTIAVSGLGLKSYVVSAELPSSKKFYCYDSQGFDGEVDSVPAGKTTCQ